MSRDDHVCKRLSSKEIAVICVTLFPLSLLILLVLGGSRSREKKTRLRHHQDYEEYKRSGDKYTVLESQTYGWNFNERRRIVTFEIEVVTESTFNNVILSLVSYIQDYVINCKFSRKNDPRKGGVHICFQIK